MLFCCIRVTPQPRIKSQKCRWQEHLNRGGNEVSAFYNPFPINYWKRYSCIPPSHQEAELPMAVMHGLVFPGPGALLSWSKAAGEAHSARSPAGAPHLRWLPACSQPQQRSPQLQSAPTLPNTAPALTLGCLADLGQEQTFLQPSHKPDLCSLPTEPFISSLMCY